MILMFDDVHGSFRHVRPVVEQEKPEAIIFLRRPECLAAAGAGVGESARPDRGVVNPRETDCSCFQSRF